MRMVKARATAAMSSCARASSDGAVSRATLSESKNVRAEPAFTAKITFYGMSPAARAIAMLSNFDATAGRSGAPRSRIV